MSRREGESEYNGGYGTMDLERVVGGKREGSDRTHNLSRSYCECTGSFACTNWCCSSSMAASRQTAWRVVRATTREEGEATTLR